MPGMDGLQTLEALDVRAPVPVIMVTAFASIELAVDAMKLGATYFLRKPMTPEKLAERSPRRLRPAPPEPIAARSASPVGRAAPLIETLTLNGFRITRAPRPIDPAAAEHAFHVTPFPDAVASTVTVVITEKQWRGSRGRKPPSATTGRRVLAGAGPAALSSFLWSEGRPPETAG